MNQLPWEKINRRIIIKKEETTSKEYGCKPEDRTIKDLLNNGVICMNKQQGPTSHNFVDMVKKVINTSKIGHGGTLDPNVFGVLPIALGDATRITQALLPAGKEYVCLMHIHKDFNENQLKEIIKNMIGKIKQLPPVRSAVKRQIREKEIYYMEVIEIKGRDVLFKIGCQGGTYVRTICTSIGRQLKTGAHMQELVRTKAGPFSDKEMYNLHDLADAFELYNEGNDKELKRIIKPIEYSIQHLSKIWISDNTVDSICHGADLSIPGIVKLETEIEKGNLIAILSLKEELIGIGEAHKNSEEIESKDKGLAVKLKKVFYQRKVYPKFIRK